MNYSSHRIKLRSALAGNKCISPAGVYDPISARIAETVGFEIACLLGSDAAATSLAAPDLTILTLMDIAEQIRRIMRVSNLSLFADADHGYGNALNVMRTVQELEHSGVAGLSIEDTLLPTPFGPSNELSRLISTEEAVGKMRAAIDARSDPSLVIAARSSALKAEGTKTAIARLKAYAATGVDAIFVVGFKTLDELDAIHTAVDLPLMLGTAPESMKRDDLAACGVRILMYGQHDPLAGSVKTLHEFYKHLYADRPRSELRERMASHEEMDQIIRQDLYREWHAKYLYGSKC